VTSALTDTLIGTLLAAAEAAAAALPAEVRWSCQAADAGTAPVPGAKAGAIAAPAGTAAGSQRLVLAVSAVLGRSVQVGPPPADDLRDGLLPAFTAAATALGLTGAEPVETPAEAALRPGPGEEVTSVTLLDGDNHVATLAIIGPVAAAGAEAPFTDEPAGHAFEALSDNAAKARVGRAGPIELLSDVEMGVTVELGRTRMLVRDILDLSPGSVIELDRAAGSPIDVMVNGTLIARGEVVVIDEEFGVRITEVIGYDDSVRR
jgi:flagellar motor switch protein FliN/FliY